MERKKMNRVTAGFAALIVLVIGLMLVNSLRRTSHIVLPAVDSATDQPSEDLADQEGALTVVEIRPDTVQAAIETLARPARYRRTLSVQQFWSGGSGTAAVDVTVSGSWTRTDRTLTDGQTRHSVTDGDTTYIWYNGQHTVFTAPAGDITADMEQSIPTYEDVLELAVEEIAVSDYRAINDVDCIYVETAVNGAGYALRYWVSVETGLLVASEKLLDGEAVYRMWETAQDLAPTVGDAFTLPDGTVLPAGEAAG